MPSRNLYAVTADQPMTDRVSIMQTVLDSSRRVSRISFVMLICSFVLFSAYLTIIYQMKQRRDRENRLLELKNEEIARRNEFIRYISATIGHEFKNNLARIKRRLDLLPGLKEDVRARIAGNMDNLFADIRVFKKISDERETELANFEEVDLLYLIEEIASHYQDVAVITVNNVPDAPSIYASSALLKTVFENLFDNAVKFRQETQPRALISVDCTIDRDGNRPYVTIAVRDRGRGMDEQQAEKCFYKGISSGDGWGEGLYFAKYVIGLHAGKIRVGKEHTTPGEGAEIIVNLPYVEETMHV